MESESFNMPATSRFQMCKNPPNIIYNISDAFYKNPFGSLVTKQLHNGKWCGYFEMRYCLFRKKRYFIAKYSTAHLLALVDIKTDARYGSITLFDSKEEVEKIAYKILDDSNKDFEYKRDKIKTMKEMLK